MLSDDVFRYHLRGTVEQLRYWVPTIADVAEVAQSVTDSAYRLSLKPRIEGACPVELMLSSERRYDITVAGERYANRPLESLDIVMPLLEAIASGNVIQRTWEAAATGAPLAVETVITLADSKVWRERRALALSGIALDDDEMVANDHYFLPYRRF